MENQKTPRNKERYPALNFKRQVKLRRDALDGIEEYVDQLNDKEKEWLNRFLEETVITNFQHKGPLIYKGKKKRREFYGENNARNRCMFTKASAMGMLLQVQNSGALTAIIDQDQDAITADDVENAMIEMIDSKREPISED